MPGSLLQCLYVTRPIDEAVGWVTSLQQAGWPAQALPLIEIAAPEDPQQRSTLESIRCHAHRYDALMFVSGAAVTHFFKGLPGLPWQDHTRFWAPGPATAKRLAQALHDQGIGAERIDSPPADAGNFDSESLWPVVCSRVMNGTRVLIVRGASGPVGDASPGSIPGAGRDWLIARCLEAGAQVEGCVAYERRPPSWTPQTLAMVREGAQPGHVWLFSSSQAVDHLCDAPESPDWGNSIAIATHPRIAQRAADIGFGNVITVRPTLQDLLSALESGWRRP